MKYHKSVYSFDLQGNFVKKYNILRDVKFDGFLPAKVCQCCKGIRKTHKGHIFKYVD